MRITAEAKRERRQAILDVARALFADAGYEGTSTRDLADAVGVAAGTLFNYFPSKQLLALELLLEAQREAHDAPRPPASTLEEALFALVAAELRAYEPWRAMLGQVFDATLSPFAPGDGPAMALRRAHLEAADGLVLQALGRRGDTVELQLYWALVTGVLGHWSRDDSPGRADTLALLDHATRMVAATLTADPRQPGQPHPPADHPDGVNP